MDTGSVETAKSDRRTTMKDMPAEFFLPPQTNAALWRETVKLVAGCVAFIVVLGLVVAMTQGIVVRF